MESEIQNYEERQEDELEFLKCVFINDLEDLREKDPWKVKRPPEILLSLTPQKSIGTGGHEPLQISIKLHAKCATDYPDTIPDLSLLEPRLLSEDRVKKLLEEIQMLAKNRVGEVMILEIAQHIQAFLHKHDRPPVSLYEEMVIRQEQEAEKEYVKRQEQEIKARMKLEEENRLLEEEFLIMKRNTLSSDSEESSTDSTPEQNAQQSLTPVLTPEKEQNDEERDDKIITRNLNIFKGKMLGTSSYGGYVVYTGMDCSSKELLVIYEWTLPCKNAKKDTRRTKQVASIKQELEGFLVRQLQHINLVQYLHMRHEIKESSITVEVAMEHINGCSLPAMLEHPYRGPITGQTLHHYCNQLLQAVYYLHSQGIVHNDIRPSLVFIDFQGQLKLGGFTIIKRLSDLSKAMGKGGDSDERKWPQGLYDFRGGKKADILKMGMVMLCMGIGSLQVTYPPTIPDHLDKTFIEFLNKCLEENEYVRYPAHELLIQPFIAPDMMSHSVTPKTITGQPSTTRLPDGISGSPRISTCSSLSRIQSEFEELEILGRGGFGDVIKVKNHLDGRLYAIKRIKIEGGSKMMDKLAREVELLSRMNHDNIVRYFTSWIETYSHEQQLSSSHAEGDSEEEYSDSSSYSDEDTDKDDLADDSVVEFRSDLSTVKDSSSGDEVFEFSSDYDSGMLLDIPGATARLQLESKLLDMSPSRFRKLETESSEGIVFQESGSLKSDTQPISISEKSVKERRHSNRRDSGQIKYLYIQMEYCANNTLRQLIDSGQLQNSKNDKEWQLFREIVEGLVHIHTQGMIHRDLKPQNIFLDSSGHIKIGDFGLATSYNKHAGLSRQNSSSVNTSILAGDTGLVGTTLYLAPELLKSVVKYTQKVDIYSLGIIFFEMCHPPLSTLMERVKILNNIRKEEIVFPSSFDHKKLIKQTYVIRWLLNHNPHDRPSSSQLLKSEHVPYKIEDEHLQEVLLRTLHQPNSARYHQLMEELFAQKNPRRLQNSFYTDIYGLEPNKKRSSKGALASNRHFMLLQQQIQTTAESVFNKHCAVCVRVPLLDPSSSDIDVEGCAHLLDSSGKILSLPHGHWVPFSRYVVHNDISYLKRYDTSVIYQHSKLPGTHPKESCEFAFDFVTSSAAELLPDAEVIAVVSDLIKELPGLQDFQYRIWLNHTTLLSAILTHCSIPVDQHDSVLYILFNISKGHIKMNELEVYFKNHNVQLTPLAMKTLLQYISSEIPISESKTQLHHLLKNKTSVSSSAKRALKDINMVVTYLNSFQIKEELFIHPGFLLNPNYFQGVMFQYVQSDLMPSSTKQSRRKQKHLNPIATGGRYDKLVGTLRSIRTYSRVSLAPATEGSDNDVSVRGVSISKDTLVDISMISLSRNIEKSQLPSFLYKCNALVCSLGREYHHDECIKLVHELRDKGAAVDVLYESLELTAIEDIQDYCRQYHIQHIIIIEHGLLIRQQVKVRSLGKVVEKGVTEKVMSINDVVEYIQNKHGLERSDSNESYTSSSQDNQSGGALPPITITTVGKDKVSGNLRRRMDSQILSKLLPLLQKYSSKSAVEIVVVEFELEPLCLLATEINKALGQDKKDMLSSVIKAVTEREHSLGKKYITKVCECIQGKLNNNVPMVFVYSHICEQCQIILNSLLIATSKSQNQ